MKRFYGTVAVAAGEPEGWQVTLDGRALKTPGKRALCLPSRPLADAIAAEWESQGETVQPDSMPLMKLAATAIDRVTDHRDAVVVEAARYAGTDLLCYRADGPAELAARQRAAWQPLLDWAALRYDAPLAVTTGILPVKQAEPSLRALRSAVAALDPLRLTAVADLTAACGSLVLALGVLEGRIAAEEAAALSLLDETFQAELWGEDQEAAVRRTRLRAEIGAAGRFLTALQAD